MKATVSSYAGFMQRRVLELKFKRDRLMGQPRRRWFCQLPTRILEERGSWQEIVKGKIGTFLTMNHHKISHC
jgi:hypothetical protein